MAVNHSGSHSQLSKSPVNLLVYTICMSLYCVMKLEYPERTHRQALAGWWIHTHGLLAVRQWLVSVLLFYHTFNIFIEVLFMLASLQSFGQVSCYLRHLFPSSSILLCPVAVKSQHRAADLFIVFFLCFFFN